MKIDYKIYRFLLTVWILCCSGMVSGASPYDGKVQQSSSWGYRPLYGAAQTQQYGTALNTAPYNGTYKPLGSVSNTPVLSGNTTPAYRFRSTSLYSSAKDRQLAAVEQPYMRYNNTNPWGDEGNPEEDDPIGVLPDYAPVGEPFVLLALAVLYIAFILFRRLRPTRTAPRRN